MARHPSVTRALEKGLRDLPPAEGHDATAALAKRYTAVLDAAPDDWERLAKLGPQLLSVLQALGMTRAAAAAVQRGEVGGGRPADERAKASLTLLRDRAGQRRSG